MDFDWDPGNAATNHAQHGVHLADAVAAFYDDRALTLEDDDPDDECLVSVGRDALGRIVVVVYTWRAGAIRLIAARNATAKECQAYEGSHEA